MLSTRSGTALYVGAVLGPGVLFLPALAARVAGPASVLAWAALLALSAPLAMTFAALGVRHPEAGGSAASVLMLSFVGWEAVSHLVGEMRDLRRAVFSALGVVVVLYLGLAVAPVGVLGTARPSDVPLAGLMAAGLGAPGRTATAAL